ncbi:MAG TPA: HDIG domain-containing protein, partial [Candidatus Hydrogenedentes bacterium]|nr:HDIG domain-containing protein [Candidatus Hydrogenedentota bacterium]
AQSIKDFKAAFASDAIRDLTGMHGPLANVQKAVQEIVEEVLTRPRLAGLTSIKNADAGLYTHSVDVCVVAVMIGRALGIPHVRMTQLAAGCLLHDIGKAFLDPQTTGARAVREHTTLGYELLRNSPDPDILAPYVAFEHHEHQDGTGLPRHLIGSNRIERASAQYGSIPTLVGEIGAVANAYDNLLSGHEGQPPLPPDQALRSIYADAGTKYNKAIVDAFLHVVPVFPLGMEITVVSPRLKNYKGVVTRVHSNRLDRPVVTLVYDALGKRIQPQQVDLTQETDLRIQCGGLHLGH